MLNEGTEVQIEVFIDPDLDRFGKGMNIRTFIAGKIIDGDKFFCGIDDPVFPDTSGLIQHEFSPVIHVVVYVIFYIHAGGYKYLAGTFVVGSIILVLEWKVKKNF